MLKMGLLSWATGAVFRVICVIWFLNTISHAWQFMIHCSWDLVNIGNKEGCPWKQHYFTNKTKPCHQPHSTPHSSSPSAEIHPQHLVYILRLWLLDYVFHLPQFDKLTCIASIHSTCSASLSACKYHDLVIQSRRYHFQLTLNSKSD